MTRQLFNFSKFIENRIANIKSADSLAFALAIGLGPWLVPLGTAIIFGYALYRSAPADMSDLRIVAAVSVAIGLIVAGAVSSHNAIISGGAKTWTLVVGYIGLEIIGLWLMSVEADVKIVGTVASLLTLIVYLSRSSAKEIDTGRSEARAREQMKIDYQVEQARLDAEHRRAREIKEAELKHAEKMARIEAKKTVSQTVSQTVPQGVPNSVPDVSQGGTLETLKPQILAELGQEKPNLTQLASRLGIGRSTLYRHLGTLSGTGEIIKNGNGYELPERN